MRQIMNSVLRFGGYHEKPLMDEYVYYLTDKETFDDFITKQLEEYASYNPVIIKENHCHEYRRIEYHPSEDITVYDDYLLLPERFEDIK